ncbi:MAG TPA: nuclear transport factor 2 family protein [Chloroflexota bacterium]|nr:nuclear transport factor 2 family protein [Chloroflexota bacterium]
MTGSRGAWWGVVLRLALPALLLLAAPAGAGQTTARAQTPAPVEVVESFVAAWNAHDSEAVLALLAEDAAIAGGWNETSGREAIRAALLQRFAEGEHLIPGEYEADGDLVRFPFTATNSYSARLGLPWREGTAVVRLREGRIVLFAQTDDPQALSRRAAAVGRLVRALPTTSPGGLVAPVTGLSRTGPTGGGAWMVATALSLAGALLVALVRRRPAG